jgi:hypothetical protein
LWTSGCAKIRNSSVKLKCQRCDIRGSADLSFIWYGWYGKTFQRKGQKFGETTLWLCPDCRLEFASKGKRDSFLRVQLSER